MATRPDHEKQESDESAVAESAGQESAVEESAAEADTIPDGGLVAWLQVAGAFFCFFNSWGIVNTYGVFQTYYETQLLTTSTPDAISWIGSLQSFLLLGSGVATGPLFDAGFLKSLVALGAVLIGLGFELASIASRYWQILLAQGLCVGLGAGCLVVPSLSLLPQHFSAGGKRALATGIAVAGGSTGGVVYPLAFQALVSGRPGFGWAARVLGLVAFVTTAAAAAVMKPRARPRRVRSPVDPAAFREPAYLCYCPAMFFSNLGFFIPVFYLQTYTETRGLVSSSASAAAHLVAILNAASVLGRLAPSLVVGRVGPVNTMAAVAAGAAVVAFCWAAVDSAAGSVALAAAYGFASGGIVSLPAVVLASVTADLRFLGARLGAANFISAFASLAGAPLAGAVLRSTGGYLGVQLLAGFALTATTLFFCGVRVARVGPRLWARV